MISPFNYFRILGDNPDYFWLCDSIWRSPRNFLFTLFNLSCLILRKKIRNLILTKTNSFIYSWLFQPTLNLLLQCFNKVQNRVFFKMWQKNNGIFEVWGGTRAVAKRGKTSGQRNWGEMEFKGFLYFSIFQSFCHMKTLFTSKSLKEAENKVYRAPQTYCFHTYCNLFLSC